MCVHGWLIHIWRFSVIFLWCKSPRLFLILIKWSLGLCVYVCVACAATVCVHTIVIKECLGQWKLPSSISHSTCKCAHYTHIHTHTLDKTDNKLRRWRDGDAEVFADWRAAQTSWWVKELLKHCVGLQQAERSHDRSSRRSAQRRWCKDSSKRQPAFILISTATTTKKGIL